MLKTLSIKNFALLVDEEIEFGDKLNILTGETGAGKTIIVNALKTILGDRVNNSVLRDGAKKAIVEGVFQVEQNSHLHTYLSQKNLTAEDNQMILRREIHESRSRAFVNDTPVQLSTLQEIGDLTVDLHGQHDHQSLLKVKSHRMFLDEFDGLEGEVGEVARCYRNLQTRISKLRELEGKKKSLKEKRELYSFQINEINQINPLPDEEDDLLKEEKLSQNSERLFRLTNEFYRSLYDSENSVLEQLTRVVSGFSELQNIDDRFSGPHDDLEQAKVIVDEISKFLQNYNTHLDFSPQRADELQDRIATIAGLKKKFGGTLNDVLAFRDQMQSELENLDTLDGEVSALRESIETEKEEFSKLCQILSEKRKTAAQQLAEVVPEILASLGMPSVRFKVSLKYQDDPFGMVQFEGQTYRANADGMDFVEFFLSTNKGDDLRPLNKIASGGEISRIMLALKSLIAKRGRIPVLVFDEIDAGVSGRIAQAVGSKLKQLANFHQVVCITHLPQIASMGHHHLTVEKTETTETVEANIRKLSSAERTEAIARLLAGKNISEAHLNSALELLADAAAESEG